PPAPETPPPMPAVTPPPGLTAPPPPAADHHAMIRAGEITAVAGVGAFIVGAAFGGFAVGAANDVDNAAKNGQAFDPAVEKRGKNDQALEAVFMTVGALGAATGAVLFFYGRHLDAQERVSVTPVATSTGGGAALRVTF
ncbi:MAG TPA: hypothetical protein VHL80_08320, partial [Polyangia bacterium]|nr:hypothetical protein [Polyangia bacterium]